MTGNVHAEIRIKNTLVNFLQRVPSWHKTRVLRNPLLPHDRYDQQIFCVIIYLHTAFFCLHPSLVGQRFLKGCFLPNPIIYGHNSKSVFYYHNH